MYIPQHFAETNTENLHALVRAHPLATVITNSDYGLNANHIPMLFVDTPPPHGSLQGHVARANPILEDFKNNREILAIFHGPSSYISPSWYATKKENGKVVPTWNYAVVHAYGTPQIRDDASWLRSFLEKITNQNESAFAQPWSIADAPADFIERLLGGIVGIEIVVTRIVGKWKISQNQPTANQSGVLEGLKARNASDTSSLVEFLEKPK